MGGIAGRRACGSLSSIRGGENGSVSKIPGKDGEHLEVYSFSWRSRSVYPLQRPIVRLIQAGVLKKAEGASRLPGRELDERASASMVLLHHA